MRVGRGLANKWAIKVVSPHCCKGAYVSRHSGHESGNQRSDSKPEQTRSAVASEHEREHFVVTELSRLKLARRNQVHRKHCQPQQSWKYDDQRYGHLKEGANDRRHLCRTNVLGRKYTLNHEKIGCPIAHRLHSAEAKHDAGPVHPHGIILKMSEVAPHMREILAREVVLNASHHPFPSAGFNQTENWNEQRAEPNQKELQNFVEDSGKQTPCCNIDG